MSVLAPACDWCNDPSCEAGSVCRFSFRARAGAITDCPICTVEVVTRERRPDGVHTCRAGHRFTPNEYQRLREARR